MSNATESISSIQDQTFEKPNFVARSINFVKTHKKATIAVSLVAGLVVANAVVNRNSNSIVLPLDADATPEA